MPTKNPLFELRKKAQLTQQELSNASGVSMRTIWNVEHGYDLKLSTAKALADALGCSTEDLLRPNGVQGAEQ